ncbi:hypothetical protein KQI84_15125 [bacterium]|nr:hypothetical protein [bacterium]
MTLRPDIAATLMRLHRNDRSRGAAGSLLEQQTRAMAGSTLLEGILFVDEGTT